MSLPQKLFLETLEFLERRFEDKPYQKKVFLANGHIPVEEIEY